MNKCKKITAFLLVLCMVISGINAFAAENITVSDTVQPDTVQSGNTLKVLAIGNSFTKDSMTYVYNIAHSAGFNVTIGILWKGSQALHNHLEFISDDSPVYNYELYSDETGPNGRILQNVSASKALSEYKWDKVFLQQTSYGSAAPASFFDEDGNSYLNQMTNIIRGKIGNHNMQFNWLMGWAYDKEYVDYLFKMFDNNQFLMYQEIVNTLQTVILPTGLFAQVLPVGTAVQNLRASYIGDNLNRDGRHLTYDLGRYEAALTVAASLGADITQASYIPSGKNSFSSLHLPALKQAAIDAVKSPYAITPSSYKNTPPVPLADISQISNESGGIMIKWNMTDDASRYIVRRSENSGSMKTLINASAAEGTSYLDKDVKNGKAYRYCVRIVYDKYLPLYQSSVVSAYFVKAPWIQDIYSVKNKNGCMKIKFSKNRAVKDYQIRYTKKDYASDPSQYTTVTSSKTSANISGLEPGAVYVVQVRGRMIKGKKSWYSAWSTYRECEINQVIQNIYSERENIAN